MSPSDHRRYVRLHRGREWPRLERGRLAVVQGVGYPNPDRSHFRSMEIWESASVSNDAEHSRPAGWDVCSTPEPRSRVPILRACTSAAGRCRWRCGPGRPKCPRSRASRVTSSRSRGTDQEKVAERTALNQLADIDRRSDDPLLGFISRTTLAAYESSGRMEQLAAKKQNGPKYPNFGLARRLELIAQIIKADFGTRIFYTSLDGFDTHANQLGTHAAL